MSYKLRLKLNYHMHNFLIPLSVENLYMTVSFFVLANCKYFINLLVTLYTDRATSIFKKFWTSKKCSDLNQEEFLSKHQRKYIIFGFYIQKKSKIK